MCKQRCTHNNLHYDAFPKTALQVTRYENPVIQKSTGFWKSKNQWIFARVENPVKSSSPPLCIIHVLHQIIVFMHIQLTRYILRLKGIILIIRCIEYNLIYYIFYHLFTVSSNTTYPF